MGLEELSCCAGGGMYRTNVSKSNSQHKGEIIMKKTNRILFFAAMLALPTAAHATTASLITLYNDFDMYGNSPAGGAPYGGLVGNGSGILYGTTFNGGANNVGTVFQIIPGQTPTPIVNFSYALGLTSPATGLVFDSAGNLYGTASSGSYGAVYEVAAGTHAVSTVIAFNGSNGSAPLGFLTTDSAGNIYGTTQSGGTGGDGTVFEIAAGTHAFTTFANFNSSSTGTYPYGGVAVDSAGNIYGTATDGGANSDGTVYKIAAGTHAFSTIASFNGSNGSSPQRSPIVDSTGDIFGVAEDGGTSSGSDGTIFEIKAGTQTITTLVNFNYNNGATPDAALIKDAVGNLFGTTEYGGNGSYGTIFEVNGSTHILTTLAVFNGANGAQPRSGLYADSSGNLYGTTTAGGLSSGVAFELTGSGYVPASVPEPTSLTLLAIGGVVLLRRRPRGKRAVSRAGYSHGEPFARWAYNYLIGNMPSGVFDAGTPHRSPPTPDFVP